MLKMVLLRSKVCGEPRSRPNLTRPRYNCSEATSDNGQVDTTRWREKAVQDLRDDLFLRDTRPLRGVSRRQNDCARRNRTAVVPRQHYPAVYISFGIGLARVELGTSYCFDQDSRSTS